MSADDFRLKNVESSENITPTAGNVRDFANGGKAETGVTPGGKRAKERPRVGLSKSCGRPPRKHNRKWEN